MPGHAAWAFFNPSGDMGFTAVFTFDVAFRILVLQRKFWRPDSWELVKTKQTGFVRWVFCWTWPFLHYMLKYVWFLRVVWEWALDRHKKFIQLILELASHSCFGDQWHQRHLGRVCMNYVDVLVTFASLVEVAFVALVLPMEPTLFHLLRIGTLRQYLGCFG